MLVSILIAAYNVDEYLENCLISCINQTYREIEIIVINDGSTDNTKKIAEKYSLLDNRIKLINKVNGGLLSARKSGVRAASGAFNFFLDGDDTIPNTSIESLVSEANEGTKMVVANYNIIKPGNITVIRSYGFIDGDAMQLLNNIYKNSLCNIWGNIYAKDLFTNVDFPDYLYKSIGEDLVLITQLAFYSGGKVKYINKETYNYFIRSNSIIGEASQKSVWALGFGAFVYITKFLKNNNIQDKLKDGYLKLLETYVIGFIVSSEPFEKYQTELNTALKYAFKHWRYFKGNVSTTGTIVFLISRFNLKFARIVGHTFRLLRNLNKN